MPYRITITNTDESYTCAGEDNLLKAMEQLCRKGIPVGCRNGGCGVCKVRVLQGDCVMNKMSRAAVSEEEQRQGHALACRVQPRSDMQVEVVGRMARAVESRRSASFSFDFRSEGRMKQSDKEN
ncbi:2Fe-2S iron-sulfur cluster-binding protein [Variovorax saccharolyticus]|uniref:2Fe-2S iron-sulfur cluster-binding protein n=1 Tax=Variovorax saccharolyticus TaxID=3053516 RepID=UPI00257808CE|nr:2Fe-2S iron-sulfur cluster-binding protein [Variovorax sp. J31P216]MDM0027500.1 2Fe-2S iron-sulfur cluster-binding protein [Variovorax sp. J31P216]